MTQDNSTAREKATQRVKELKDLYNNVISYIVTNFVLLLINLFTSPGFLWVRYVAFFWGIGLLFHAASVYFFNGKVLGNNWEEKKIEELTEQYSKK